MVSSSFLVGPKISSREWDNLSRQLWSKQSCGTFSMLRRVDHCAGESFTLTLSQAAAVLGIPHQDFGEVPVAVLESRVGTRIDKKGVQSAAAASLGEHYTLEHVFELEDLGLHKWPLNPTGKVMKVALKANILSRLKARAD